VIAHSYRRRVAEIRLNGRKVGEFGFNAALAGHFNVPVTLVSGDEAVCAEARALLPHILAVPVKKGLGAYSALCLHPKQAQALIHEFAKQALSSTERGAMPSIDQPTVLEVRFTTASAIDRCLRLPGAELRDGTTLRYEARDVLEAFQVFNVMADLAELVPHI
jgi:D-amino peptidase